MRIVPPSEHVPDQQAQWRQTDPAGDDEDVAADGGVDRPGVAEWPAHAQHAPLGGAADRSRYRADGAHGENDLSRRRRAADRDRDLADTERVDHHELARSDRR